MPYLHLDLPGRFPVAQKRELAVLLCRLYADVMQTQSCRPNIGIAELGEDNLFHLGPDGLEPIVMVLVQFRAGRPSEYRLKLADGIVDACVEILGVPRRWVQSRSRKFGQSDKWNFCLKTAIVAVNGRNHEQTPPPEPLTGLQGEGGSGRRQGRPHHRPAGGAFRRSPQPDYDMEISA